VPTTRTLTINGVAQDLSADRSWTIATGLTIGTTPIASGTIGRVLFQGTGNVLQQSSSLFWDGTNERLGIGTSTPLTSFHLAGSSTAVSLLARSSLIASTLVASANNDVLIGLDIAPTFNNGAFTGVSNLGIRLNSEFLVSNGRAFTTSSGATANSGGFAGGQFFSTGTNTTSGSVTLQTFFAGIGYTAPLRINPLGGNVLINTTTDAGFRLDVNGTARVSPTLTINGTAGAAPILQLNANGFNSNNQYFVFRASNADKFQFGYTQGGASNRLFIYNPLFANDALRIMEATNNVGINTTTDAGFRLDVNGTARVSGVLTAAGNYIQYGTNPSVGIGSTNNGNSFVNNGPALLYASANINSTQVYAHNFFTGTFNSTSGVQGLANLTGANFSPTSGTAVFNTINANPTINQTGGANGITRGLYVNPTLTSASDFRAIETTAGRIVFGNLPTSSAGLPTGAIWNDGGTLKIV
jgi:hypothetical protein